MSNYIEYNDKIAFHPGYYIKEIVDDSQLTQEDFAKRLDTTPKNLSLLIRGEQNLSIDIAMKLSRMLGTSVSYWLNLQASYNTLVADFNSEKELLKEKVVFRHLDYKYFRENFGLHDLPRKIDEQIFAVRELLGVATLSVLTKKDMAVSFRSSTEKMGTAGIVKSNAMVQVATNLALDVLKKNNVPPYNKKAFEQAVEKALTLTTEHKEFYNSIRDSFEKAGVIFVILPNMPGSNINGATKKIGKNILLMVNDSRLYADSFWFTLFHEIGHILNEDYGISFDKESGDKETEADIFAQNKLIPLEDYQFFVKNNDFSVRSVKAFAKDINRDPGIVVGRLEHDGWVKYSDPSFKQMKRKYKVIFNV